MRATYIILATLTIFYSCTDVVDVAVPAESPRLVIEASLDWEKGTTGNEQTIKLSLSTPFFNTGTVPAVTDATVSVTQNIDGTMFIFQHIGDGLYSTSDFTPQLNESYTLEVLYEGEVYTAIETLVPVPEITSVFQSIEDGFDEEAIEINFTFNDPAGEENFYFTVFNEPNRDLLPDLDYWDDEFNDGNEITIFYEKDNEDSEFENFQPGDIVDISFHGISRQYYDYIALILEQTETGDPFSTTPVPVKGNCINTSNPDNDPYGYFRVTEVERREVVIE